MKVFLLVAIAVLMSCGQATPSSFNEAGWSTKGNPIVLQKLSGGDLENGVYRYLDKETGVVLYIARNYGSVSITSQKVTK